MTHAGGRPSIIPACKTWMKAYLSGGMRLFEKDVKRVGALQQPAFSECTLKRAKKELGFVSVRKGFGAKALYYWRDPSVPDAELDATRANQAREYRNRELKSDHAAILLLTEATLTIFKSLNELKPGDHAILSLLHRLQEERRLQLPPVASNVKGSGGVN
jgi:hypothetical protein